MRDTFPEWAKNMRLAMWTLDNKDLGLTPVEADKRARRMRGKGVNTVISFGFHFRWDWIDARPRIREATRISVAACHANGIKYVEHHSAFFASRLEKRTRAEFDWLEQHLSNHTVPRPPGLGAEVFLGGHRVNDWYVLNLKVGGPEYWPSYRAVGLCPNNPDCRKAYSEYLEDILDYTHADGIMSDDITMGRDYYACVCSSCRSLFTRETGIVLPKTADSPFWGDFTNAGFKAWLDFRIRSERRHFERIDDLLRRRGKPLLHTTCACGLLLSKAANVYEMTSVFNTTFMEMMYSNQYFHDWRSNSAELRTYRALAREKGNPSFAASYPRMTNGDQFFVPAFCRMEEHSVLLMPDLDRHSPQATKLDPRWYLWEQKHDDLFRTTDTLAAVGVMCSPSTLRYYRGVRHELYAYEIKGWCGVLQQAGIDYDMVLESQLNAESLRKYRALLIPNGACLSPAHCGQIADYVRAGGRIIATHETSLFDERGNARKDFGLSPCLGVKYLRTIFDEHYQLQARMGDDRFLAGVTSVIPHRAPYVAVEPRDRATTAVTSFVDCGGVGRDTLPAIVEHSFGKGSAVYVAGKPGVLVYHPGLIKVAWDGHEPCRYLDFRMPEWIQVITNIVRVTAGILPIELKGVKTGVIFHACRLADGRLAVYILNVSGSEIPHRTYVPADTRLKYPSPTAPGAVPQVECNLKAHIRGARLYSPDGAEGEPLKLSRSGNTVRIAVPPQEMKRFCVVVIT